MDNPQSLIDAYLDQELSAEQMAEFEQWLCADAENMRLFVRSAHFQCRLRESVINEHMIQEECKKGIYQEGELTDIDSELLNPLEKSSEIVEDKSSPSIHTSSPLEFISNSISQIGDIISKPTPLSIAMAFIVIVSFLTTLALISTSDSPKVDEVVKQDQLKKFVATVVNLRDCRWSETSSRIARGQRVRESESFELLDGLVQVTFDSGATVVLEGPASFVIQSNNSAELREGKALANVPPMAKGFAVHTPSVKVVDLGTQFGIEVNGEGSSDVHVFIGNVEAVVSDTQGNVINKVPLKANESAFFDVDRKPVTLAIANAEQFKRNFELSHASMYVDVVKAAKPLIYWRFEEIKNGHIKNEMSSRHHAKVVGNVKLSKSSHNRTAVFQGDETVDRYLIMEDSIDGLLWGDYTIELWVKADRIQKSTLVRTLSYPKVKKGNKLMYLGLSSTSGPEDIGNTRLRFSHMSNDENHGSLSTKLKYTPGKWHHLVARKYNNKMQVYLDGELAGSTAVANLAVTNAMSYIVLGKRRATATEDCRYLDGEIDEVAIYRHILRSQEIKKHYRLGRP